MTFISGFLSGSSLAVPVKIFGKTPDIVLMMYIQITKVFPVCILKSSFIYNTDHGEKVTQNNIKWVSVARKDMKMFRLLSTHKQTYAKKMETPFGTLKIKLYVLYFEGKNACFNLHDHSSW